MPAPKGKLRVRTRYRGREVWLGTADTPEEVVSIRNEWWAKKGFPNGRRPLAITALDPDRDKNGRFQ